MFPSAPLTTTDGVRINVLDPGLWNHDAGPDFFNAKIRIGGETWVGNVEMHLRSSDWLRHGHDHDTAYSNVILHVVGEVDCSITMPDGRSIPQIVLPIPDSVRSNFEALMAEEAYPPCYRVIPSIPTISVHSWMNALTVERLEQKTERIDECLRYTEGDWERVFFISLARSIGFGVNSEAFAQWATLVDFSQVGKHRDHLEQVEAYFLGIAGLLDRAMQKESDEHAALWQREWTFLSHKFQISPMEPSVWRYLRMRPQNFPHARILQLAACYHRGTLALSQVLNATTAGQITDILREAFSSMGTASINSIIINAIAPTLFAHGRSHANEAETDLAFSLLEGLKPEDNHITRAWQSVGLHVDSAADSQALIQLRKRYCDRHDCLRCRFGAIYMSTPLNPQP